MFFLVPAHPGSPGQRAVKRLCMCVCVVNKELLFVYYAAGTEISACANTYII